MYIAACAQVHPEETEDLYINVIIPYFICKLGMTLLALTELKK